MTATGAALALALSWYGHNGLDPQVIKFLPPANGLRSIDVNGAKLKQWLAQGNTAERRLVLAYVVRCALDTDEYIEIDGEKVRGQFGLLGPSPLEDDDEEPGKKRLGRTALLQAGKWISACLMAFSNLKDAEEIIALRGNPPFLEARQRLRPGDYERWAFGHPEGVFAADLFTNPARKLFDSLTLSMNLPDGYLGTAGWAPPNASVGRTLDYKPATVDGKTRVAYRAAPFHKSATKFRLKVTLPEVDPDYAVDEVCVGGEVPGQKPRILQDCSEGGTALPVLFVHLPRMASFASASATDTDPAQVPFRVVITGGDPVTVDSCDECVGPHPYLRANGIPTTLTKAPKPKKVVGLSALQTLEARFSFVAALEAPGQRAPPDGERFTVAIRYRCPSGPCAASIKDVDGIEIGSTFKGTAGRFGWAWAHPVPARGGALTVSITGGVEAPELDAVAFYPGTPTEQCFGELYTVNATGAELPYRPAAGNPQFSGICRTWPQLFAAKAAAHRAEAAGSAGERVKRRRD